MVNFHASSWKSKDLHFNLNTDFTLGFVFQSVQTFRWKSAEALCLMTLKSDAKFEEKLLLSSKNDMRNLVNFNASSGKSGNLHFDVLLLPNIKFQPKEYSRILLWHCKMIQTLKKNWLFIWKITCGILL